MDNLESFSFTLNFGGDLAVLDAIERGLVKVRDSARAAGEGALSFSHTLPGIATYAQVAGVAIAGLTKALDTFGDKALEAFGDRSGTLRAYTALLGDAAKAEQEFRKAQALSQRTDLTSSQVEGAQKALMVAGFRGENLDRALLSVTDLGAMAAPKERELMVERSARALAQIFAKGKLQGEELRQLSEAGVSRGLVLKELQGRGAFGGDAGAVEKSITKGKVSAEEGIAAIQRALLQQFGTSKLGEFATGSAGSLSGLLSNRDELFQNLLKSFTADDELPAIDRYKSALKAQAAALDVSTESGSRAVVVLQDMANTSIALKSAWTDFSTAFVDSFTSTYKAVMEEMGVQQDGLNSLGDAAKTVGEVLGKVGTAAALFVRVFDYIAPVVTAVTQWFYELGVELGAIGKLIVDVLAGDFTEAKKDIDEYWSASNLDQKRRDKEARAAREKELSYFDSAGGEGTGTTLGGGGVGGQFGTTTLKNWGSYKLKGEGKGGGKGGSGGGGTFGAGGSFVPDFGDLDGVALPMVSVGPSPTYQNYQAAMQADLTAGLQRQAAAGSATVVVENVTIEVDGAQAPEAIAQAVADTLRGLGRYQRTPSPSRS